MHRALLNHRPRKSHEFFDITVPKAIATIRELVDVENYEEKIFYRDPNEMERENQQRNKVKEIKNRTSTLENNLIGMLDNTQSKIHKKITENRPWWESDVLFVSGGILSVILLVFMFMETLENIWWVLLIHGGLTWFFYSSHISEKHEKVDEKLKKYSNIFRKKRECLEGKLLDDPEWRKNMYIYENEARNDFRKIMIYKEKSMGN